MELVALFTVNASEDTGYISPSLQDILTARECIIGQAFIDLLYWQLIVTVTE